MRTGFGEDGRDNTASRMAIMVRHGGRLMSNRSCTTGTAAAQPEDFMPEGSILEFPD